MALAPLWTFIEQMGLWNLVPTGSLNPKKHGWDRWEGMVFPKSWLWDGRELVFTPTCTLKLTHKCKCIFRHTHPQVIVEAG